MGESYVLEKNDNYWDAENVTLEKLTYRYILDLSTALTAFENNEVDGVRMVSSGDIARLKAEKAGLNTAPIYGTVYYNFNCEKEPYNNPLVRKALNLAIDRDAIINNVAPVSYTHLDVYKRQLIYPLHTPSAVRSGSVLTSLTKSPL